MGKAPGVESERFGSDFRGLGGDLEISIQLGVELG
jgi:hypothetical protein